MWPFTFHPSGIRRIAFRMAGRVPPHTAALLPVDPEKINSPSRFSHTHTLCHPLFIYVYVYPYATITWRNPPNDGSGGVRGVCVSRGFMGCDVSSSSSSECRWRSFFIDHHNAYYYTLSPTPTPPSTASNCVNPFAWSEYNERLVLYVSTCVSVHAFVFCVWESVYTMCMLKKKIVKCL